MTASAESPRASRFEILGAWLHVWAPPRGVEIPAPPSPRRIAAWTAAIVVVVGIALAIAVPRIDSAKDDRAAQVTAAEAAQDAAQRAAIVRAQRASFGTSAATAPAAQLADARGAILADARSRHAAAELERPILGVGCQPAKGGSRLDLERYSCVAQTARLADVAAGPRRNVGYPFTLVVEPATGRFAWCRTMPVPAEGSTGHSGQRIPQPAVCTGAATPAAR